MWKTEEGSTGRLLQLCMGYFFFYVITGITVKYFQGKPEDGLPGFNGIEFLTYSTLGGTMLCLVMVLIFRWYRLQSNRETRLAGISFPSEYYYIIPSGVCTAVIIPATTLMYSLSSSVMVAMIIMRGSVIVVSRLVDLVQSYQGILKKKVFWEENIAIVSALGAISTVLFANFLTGSSEGQDTFGIPMAAIIVLISYIAAYAIRIYIMNYFKNTRAKGVKLDNNGFFGIEQISAAFVLGLVALLFFYSPSLFGLEGALQIEQFQSAVTTPRDLWPWAILAGMAFGGVAFFSVFIFMFKGRTATFAGLVNRLTSLIAGTMSTLLFAFFFNPEKYPDIIDWISLGFILLAVGFLSLAEKKRALEKKAPQGEPKATQNLAA